MARRAPQRRPSLKACKNCGALVFRDNERCPVCGSNQFTEDWKGMIVVIDPEASALAKELGIDKTGMFALSVGGKPLVTRKP